jgi:hypothetical protein
MNQPSSRFSADYGLSYLLWLSVVIILLITINGGIVDLVLSGWKMDRPFWLDEPRVLMAIGKIVPFLMLVGEYWVFDFFVDRLRRPAAATNTEIS